MKTQRIAVDLFAGCGGLTEGLKQAGWCVCGAIEIASKPADAYRLNHPEVDLIQEDIGSLDLKHVVSSWEKKFGPIDLVAGCPPCQGFSRLRTKNRKGQIFDHRNELIFSLLEFVELSMPHAVMLENVPALLGDKRLKKFSAALRRMGYRVAADCLNVRDYGVAQNRFRTILLATRTGEPPRFGANVGASINVRDVIGGLVEPGKSNDAIHDFPERRSKRVSDFIRMVPKDGGSRKDVDESFQLPCHVRTSGYSDVYGRMAWDRPAPTITGGCSNPSKGRFLHPERDSAITLREAAMLQGFPQKYRFNPAHGKEDIALMIGNALPPPFIRVHARELLRCIS